VVKGIRYFSMFNYKRSKKKGETQIKNNVDKLMEIDIDCSREEQETQIKNNLEQLMKTDIDMIRFIHNYTSRLIGQVDNLNGKVVVQLRKASLDDKSNLSFKSVFDKTTRQAITLEYCNASTRAVAVLEEDKKLKEQWMSRIEEKTSLLMNVHTKVKVKKHF